MNLTQEDIKNTIALIHNSTVKGADSVTVATLLQKYQGMLVEVPKKEEHGGKK